MGCVGGLWCGLGVDGVKAGALNLLRHPRRAAWGTRVQRVAFGVGLVMGALGVLGLAVLHAQWTQAQAHWQARLEWLQQQQKQRRAEIDQAQQQRLQAEGWRQIHARQEVWRSLQSGLQAEAGHGLSLVQWQADEARMWLRGRLTQAESLPDLQTRLGQQSGLSWALHSLDTERTLAGANWTLVAAWPAASVAAGASR